MPASGGTAGKLAASAGVDADNAARWPDAMVTAGRHRDRDGAGIRSAEFQAALGIISERVNVPMDEQLLVPEWTAGHPELHAALEAGIDAAEIGTGGGTARRLAVAGGGILERERRGGRLRSDGRDRLRVRPQLLLSADRSFEGRQTT